MLVADANQRKSSHNQICLKTIKVSPVSFPLHTTLKKVADVPSSAAFAICFQPPRVGDMIMDFHKRILEWQAAHPNITWICWGIVWAAVLAVLFWPRTVE